jgi:UDP-N-acetylglucosamine 2-epimerase (non-hydrolysing)
MKVTVIFGTRPEAIKLAPVVMTFRALTNVDCKVCVTGQHKEMLNQVLEVFNIAPDENLHLMRSNQTLAELSSAGIQALDSYFSKARPDLVVVQGDTTTVFIATLVAFYHHIPCAHVEAGLRTWNLQSPWPEEANRVLTTKLASLHFAPTESARRNLIAEGVAEDRIWVTGNTVIDALLLAVEKIEKGQVILPENESRILDLWGDAKVVLITGHRRENFGNGMESICHAIARLAEDFPLVQILYAVHLNPNVKEPVARILGGGNSGNRSRDNVFLTGPLPYLSFVAMMNRASLILTDSGGVQEEAPSLGKPVLVMRETTERPEAVDMGTAKLVGTDSCAIYNETARLLTDQEAHNAMAKAHNPYGDGKAAQRIVEKILESRLGIPKLRTRADFSLKSVNLGY